MLFAVFEYKGLWPDNRKHVLLFFCRKNSPLITHYSLLKSRFRSPSLQTADVWGTLEYHGFKNPRLFALSGIASFRRLYLFTERRKRLEDANMNSRGLSSLRFIMSVYKWRLEDANRQRRLFKRYSLNAHCSQFISQNCGHPCHLCANRYLLPTHHSMSNIFTFSREPYIGSKMNKNRLK